MAWPRVWSRLFGTGEAGLRSLSALFGIATVFVAYLAGARLFSRAAGLVVAALTAVSPFMVWYSQEARSYALFMLLAALSIYFYACLRDDARPAVVVAWGAVCAAAIWTHYFAIYVVAMEALLLIVLVPRVRRAVAAALLAVVVVSVPVAALAIHQARVGNPGRNSRRSARRPSSKVSRTSSLRAPMAQPSLVGNGTRLSRCSSSSSSPCSPAQGRVRLRESWPRWRCSAQASSCFRWSPLRSARITGSAGTSCLPGSARRSSLQSPWSARNVGG